MRIKCLMRFLDGKDEFLKDDIRTVDDERGARFVAAGWAEDEAGRVATESVSGNADLNIQNSAVGLGDNHG